MEVNEKVHGFIVQKIEEVEDCNGILYTLLHEQSGARLLYLERDDENKTFGIAFKTVPTNDTGVFHILEHSLLNGSRKYPVKEPFVELLKGSLQTFLNAMTYPDKTFFPIASKNDKDFMNLMDTYLDAVFYPSIYTNPNIFYQEGWHYEIQDENDDPVYQGVVYSEMQGAFSSLDEVIMNEANAALYPDTCYKYESGGDPECIVKLSYEEFINTHKKFYHPSNSYIFLDGKMDIDTVLNKIDGEYLSNFTTIDVSDIRIETQTRNMNEHRIRYYEIDENEQEKNRTVIAFAKIICDDTDTKKIVAYSALQDYLIGSNKSILKKELLSRGLCEDVELAIMDGTKQPYMMLVIRNTEQSKEQEIKTIVHDAITKLVQDGLDKEMLEASLNQMEFSYREPSEPAGVIYGDDALKAWLYDDDPMIYLNRSTVYSELRKELETSYFEDLLKEFFLGENSLTTMVFVPSKTLAKERLEKVEKELKEIKESWEDVDHYVEISRNLKKWQMLPNTEEELATLPKLSISDIEPIAEHYEPIEKEIRGVPVLLYPEGNRGVVYFNMYFSFAGIKKQDLPALSLYARLLGDLPTEHYDEEELQKLVRRDIGSLSISALCLGKYGDASAAVPQILVSCSVLEKNLDKAIDLIFEIIQNTKFTKEDIKPLIAQNVDNSRQALISSGQSIALLKAVASFSASASASEQMAGFTQMKWLYDLLVNYDTKIDAYIDQAYLFTDVLFTSSRLTISVNGEKYLPTMEKIIDRLPISDFQRCVVHYPLEEKKNSGIVIASKVSYVARAGNIDTTEYRGYLNVLSQILTYEYLWNEVRAKSGAYGTGFSGSLSGVISAYSYRDPHPDRTIDTMKDIVTFLDEFLETEEDLTTYIVGTIAQSSPLLSPSGRIRGADRNYFMGVTYDMRQENRTRILSTTVDDLKKLKDVIEIAWNDGVVSVVGPEEVMEKCFIMNENKDHLG